MSNPDSTNAKSREERKTFIDPDQDRIAKLGEAIKFIDKHLLENKSQTPTPPSKTLSEPLKQKENEQPNRKFSR